MAVYGYTRVSTTAQAEEGESLNVQRRAIEGYAMMNDFDVDKVFVERGVSGSKAIEERPQGSNLMAMLGEGDILIASKLDRVFRSALDALQMVDTLKAKKVSLHLIDLGGDISGNGISKLFLTIAAAFAEAERDRIRERILNVKEDQRQRGRYLGGRRPFGYQIDGGGLVEDNKEQRAIKKAKKMHKEGASLRSIAEELEKDGHKLSHMGIKRILD